jgi:DNA-binding Xre family transcriptional regulator
MESTPLTSLETPPMTMMTPPHSSAVSLPDLLDRRVHWRLRHEVIQHTRMACRCTQAHLASRLGISVRHLRRIETGSAYGRASGFRIRTPSNLDLLDRLCFELGLEYGDLLEAGAGLDD